MWGSRNLRAKPAPKPYCSPDEHTYVQVVGGKGYDEDYDTKVCVYCHSHYGVRKPEATTRAPHPATMIGRPSHQHQWAPIPDPSGYYVGAECRTCGVVRDDDE